jgi:hypothetical protein
VFADGFAAFDPASPTPRAAYRPIGIARAPDGSLFIADSQKGRIWRIKATAALRPLRSRPDTTGLSEHASAQRNPPPPQGSHVYSSSGVAVNVVCPTSIR